jgi:transposase
VRADQWTCRHVGTVIRRSFGVKYHPDHVSRILRALGWNYKGKNSLPSQRKTEKPHPQWSSLRRRHR